MAIFGKLAYGEGATVGTLLAVRFALAAALFWALARRGGRASCARSPAATSRSALGARRVRLRAPGRLLLRRARADRRLAAVAAALHVPGDRRRRRGRARPRAARRAHGSPRWRSPRAGSRSSSPAPAPARSTRSAPRSASPPRSSTAPTSSSARRSPARCARTCSPRWSARARRSSLTRRLGGCSATCGPATLTAAGWGWLAVPRGRLDRRRDRPVLRRPPARRPTTASILATVEPLVDRAARVPRLRRDAGPSSSPAARSCSRGGAAPRARSAEVTA